LTIRGVFNERSEVNGMGFAHAYLELGEKVDALQRGELTVKLSVQRGSTTSSTVPLTGTSSTSNWPPKRSAGAASRSNPFDESEFEDQFDISNVDLSPPELAHIKAHASGLRRVASHDIGRRVITGRRDPIDIDGEDNTNRPGSDALIRQRKQCHEALLKLRSDFATANNCSPARIFDDATLHRISDRLPASISALAGIQGVGDEKYEAYGREVLELTKKFATKAAMPSNGPTTWSNTTPFNVDQFAYRGEVSPSKSNAGGSGGNERQKAPQQQQQRGGPVNGNGRSGGSGGSGMKRSVTKMMPIPGSMGGTKKPRHSAF